MITSTYPHSIEAMVEKCQEIGDYMYENDLGDCQFEGLFCILYQRDGKVHYDDIYPFYVNVTDGREMHLYYAKEYRDDESYKDFSNQKAFENSEYYDAWDDTLEIAEDFMSKLPKEVADKLFLKEEDAKLAYKGRTKVKAEVA